MVTMLLCLYTFGRCSKCIKIFQICYPNLTLLAESEIYLDNHGVDVINKFYSSTSLGYPALPGMIQNKVLIPKVCWDSQTLACPFIL